MRASVQACYKILLIFLVIGIAFFAVSCSADIKYADPKVTAIAIYELSKVDGYVAGDELDIDNAKILVTYDNGEQETVDLTPDMIDFTRLDMTESEDSKTVRVVYGGAETSFTISVKKWNFSKVELTALPHKTIYIEGQFVDPTGAELSVHYDGGNIVKMQVTDNMLEDYSKSVGKRNIKINYRGVENLTFEVEFLQQTVVRLEIMRVPRQASVFQNYGERLAREDMKIRLIYDSGVAEIYENAIIKSGSNPEAVAAARALWKDKIDDNLIIDIDDASTVPVDARVAYKEPDLTSDIVYSFNGTARVRVGDIVDVGTILATTNFLQDIISKSQGQVVEVLPDSIVVSRTRVYTCNVAAPRGNRALDVGDIVLNDELVGTQAGSRVTADIAGIVTKKTATEISVLAVPVNVFPISVVNRDYQSMEIIKYPITAKHATPIDKERIIQGDTLDLATGRVRVTYNNGETQEYLMSNTYVITVRNQSTNMRREIPGLQIAGVGDVSNVPAGENYNLLYDFVFEDGYSYALESLKTIVSVLDESGNIDVANNRTIVPMAGKNYRVSIMVTYIDHSGKELVNEASYMIATVGAPSLPERLDISAAGSHTLKVFYEHEDNYIEFDVFVEQKVPVRIIIEEGTDNIGQQTFYRGDSLPFSTIKYMLAYSNGDIDDISTGVTKNMVVGKSKDISDDFMCNEIGVNQYIEISIPQTSVEKQRLYFNVIPLPIVDLSVVEEPLDVFLTAKGITNDGIAGVTAINLTGARFLVSYHKGSTQVLHDNNENLLLKWFNNGKNDVLPSIKIAYEPDDETMLTEEEIYGWQKKHYIATVTYTDVYGETATAQLKYYIVERKPKAIKVTMEHSTAEWSYKKDYIQSENWDFEGMNLMVSYDGEGGSTVTESVPLKPYMVYNTHTDKVDNEIPLVIRYFGVLEEVPTVKFNVKERQETGIVLQKPGTIHYVTTGAGLDLSGYIFAITFNAGVEQTISGIFSFDGNATKRGWWYEVYDAEVPLGKTEPEPVLDGYGRLIISNMRVTGDKMIRLFHTSELEIDQETGDKRYNSNFIDFYVKVDIRTTSITKISFDDTNEYRDNVPVLGMVAVGTPLVYTYLDTQSSTLKEKLLTIHYEDGTKGWLELSHANVSIDYKTIDKSLGTRTVKVSYDKFECTMLINVLDADLVDINLIDAPTTNFINGDNFSIDGGILSATYKEKGSDLSFVVYVLMSDQTPLLEYEKIDCIIDYYDEQGNYKEKEDRTIKIEYGIASNKTDTSYVITIYNPQDVVFSYSNLVNFYGGAVDAMVTAHQRIEGFVLPTQDDPRTPEDESNPDAIKKYYVSSEFFLYMTEEEYEIAKQSNPNLIPIVILGEDKKEMIAYYDMNNVVKYNGQPSRPFVPVKKGYDYYILMMVEGNTYYRTRNYCLQKYAIISKAIEVYMVNANENAFVYRVSTTDNPTAIRSLYSDINAINSQWTSQYSYIQKVELASPNKDYFEILITVTTEYNDSNYGEIVGVFNSINNQIQNYQKDGVKVSITGTSITKGVNIAQYSGSQPQYITYTMASGATLTYKGVLDLLEGKLEIAVDIDQHGNGIFGVGDYSIVNSNDTLHHNNYILDIITSIDTKFRVVKCVMEEMYVQGNEANGWQPIKQNQTLTITQGDEIIVNVIVDLEKGITRQARAYEIRYYTDEACREEDLVDGELTARTKPYYAKLVDGYYLYYDQLSQEYKDYTFSFQVKVNAT